MQPSFGQKGGQEYPVLKSIQTFLKQMAEGGARPAPTVLKELLQNADDAGASELAIILDERNSGRISSLCPQYAALCSPALIVRNNRPFRQAPEVSVEHDDFTNILNVAGGHKWAQATAAGRFGIGFNSVYFLTDTPLIFSRREIHIFDLLKEMFGENGWRFPLDDFPRGAGIHVGPMKELLDWCLPASILQSESLGSIAGNPNGDYRQSVFRLPLRRTLEGTHALYDDRFPDFQNRQSVVADMVDEASQSIHFLKNIFKISFSLLRDRQLEPLAVVDASPSPADFSQFVEKVNELAKLDHSSEAFGCAFERVITRRDFTLDSNRESSKTWRFHVRHVARFDDDSLLQLRDKLRRNEEKATPWIAVAVPLDFASCRLAGGAVAKWRVFLPLLEDGPCGCLVHGAFFVGPSRQRLEYRLDQSDAQKRKTEWNQQLVDKALSPLLRDISLDLPELAKELLEKNPKEYLNLFPEAGSPNTTPNSLTEFLRHSFSSDAWALRLRDIWNEPFDLLMGDGEVETIVELVPEWLLAYGDRFKDLACDRRRFVRFVLGDALAARTGDSGSITIHRSVSLDVALKVLRHPDPTKPQDLEKLLKTCLTESNLHQTLEGAWAFQDQGTGELLRFKVDELCVLEEPDGNPIIEHLRRLQLSFENTNWVRPDVGLPKLLNDVRPALTNILKPTAEAALELLRRLPVANSHDQLEHDYDVTRVVDFLVAQQPGRLPGDLRLGFLVRTAHAQEDRRALGVLLLKPSKSTTEEQAFEEVWFRRVFAHVDSKFEALIQKLLTVHPACLEMLHAAGCKVTFARSSEVFGVLHEARLKKKDFCVTLQNQMATAQQNSKLPDRVAACLLDSADTAWDSLDEAQRYTVLALPIHRCSDGNFIPLVSGNDADMASVVRGFWLQSQDTIEDAPIKLPTCRLLQTPNASVKRFYRLRLNLRAHNKVEVLKETLRQIGEPTSDDERNVSMLRYLVRHYEPTLTALDGSGDSTDKLDADELRVLMVSARTVPCINDSWNPAHDCAEAWQISIRLLEQGWPKKRLVPLMNEMFSGKNIAKIDSQFRDLLPRLHQLTSWDSRKIVELAVSSESIELGLKDRAKLFWDNRRDLPDAGVVRSNAAGMLQVPTHSGQVTLAEAEFFESTTDLPERVFAMLAPKAIASAKLTAELKPTLLDLPVLLRAFHVTELSAQDFENRLIEHFADLWPDLNDAERLQVLRYIDSRKISGQIAGKAQLLNTVLVRTRKPSWKTPSLVVSPHWARTKPPLLPLETLPVLEKTADAVLRVWNEWCGIRTFDDIFPLVVYQASKTPTDKRTVAKETYAWIDNAVTAPLSAEELQALNTHAWVLAERNGIVDFKKPAEVLVHAGEKILVSRFWVRATPLPNFCKIGNAGLEFTSTPPATASALEEICHCLVEPQKVDETAVIKVYELVVQLLEDLESLRPHWVSLAQRLPVYRAFREPDLKLTSLQLFLGDNELKDDFSANLVCLKSNSRPPKGLTEIYRRLGISERETLEQVLGALTIIAATEPNANLSFGRLVNAMRRLAEKDLTQIELAKLEAIRVPTCAGTFERLDSCHWDDVLGRKERIVAEHAGLLVDTQNPANRRLAEWLGERYPAVISHLCTHAQFEAADVHEPVSLAPEVIHLLNPWRRWLKDLANPESALRGGLSTFTLKYPQGPLELIVVNQIRLRCRLRDGKIIDQSSKWEGPPALAESGGRLLIHAQPLQEKDRKEIDWLGDLDKSIGSEIARLLQSGVQNGDGMPLLEEILKTLERPATVLRRLHDNYREHFIHQYQDQVADPEFADLFDQYQRTDPRRSRAEELKARMFELLTAKFVQARREQIRGYGYDEFSVFAELLQNAEDAYLQREQLGMETRTPREVVYRYVSRKDARLTLEVEHRGRPFNYAQHGTKHFPNFSKDVEGVLRSAGSFKPSIRDPGQPDSQTIGRFGLGFKCVYLLTDRPEIHSDDWHFAIEAGCLPKELPRPDDLPEDVTRIRLPLRNDVTEVKEISRFIGLVPFLRMITCLQVNPSNEESKSIVAAALKERIFSNTLVEQVEISVSTTARGSSVRIMRCRSNSHAGQLALLLAQDGTPARWDEVFSHDLYAALPMQARLGCGLAASHRFEVQSGRTHLVDPNANESRIVEIISLLEGLLHELRDCAAPNVSLSEILKRFWSIWQWERGDVECERLRRSLANELVQLAEQMDIVPTLAPDNPTRLGQGPCFYFYELPDDLRHGLVAAQVTMSIAPGSETALNITKIVVEGFATAYRRACEYAGKSSGERLLGIGWSEIAAAFRARPWFCKKPNLLNLLASTLKEEQFLPTGKWVSQCQVLGSNDNGDVLHDYPGNLLPPEFPGHQHLPQRFLRRVSNQYNDAGLKLLGFAGLPNSPSEDNLRNWACATDLKSTEGVGILTYLSEEDRFKNYWELSEFFRSPWFPAKGKRLTSKEAASLGLIPEEIIGSDIFRTWLGIEETDEEPPEPPRPQYDTREVLSRLYEWWQTHGDSWTSAYVERVYPRGTPPAIRKEFAEKDLSDRREWTALLLLGSMQTIGRSNPEQHRNFLSRCDEKGWLDVFADGNQDARRWMDMLEGYLEDPTGTHDYYQWMKQFVVIFQISRWLPDYVESFLNVNRMKKPFAFDDIVSPRTSPLYTGGGPDAPALTRALGIGACFIMRELTRLEILNQKLAHRYCYVPGTRICGVLETMGSPPSLRILPTGERSSGIHRFLVENMDQERATFNLCFDLPFLALREREDAQVAVFGEPLPSEEGSSSRADAGWRTLPDGRRINLNW